MVDGQCDRVLQVRVPQRLAQAVDSEAQRLMLSKSALVRTILARELALTGQVAVPTDHRRDDRS